MPVGSVVEVVNCTTSPNANPCAVVVVNSNPEDDVTCDADADTPADGVLTSTVPVKTRLDRPVSPYIVAFSTSDVAVDVMLVTDVDPDEFAGPMRERFFHLNGVGIIFSLLLKRESRYTVKPYKEMLRAGYFTRSQALS